MRLLRVFISAIFISVSLYWTLQMQPVETPHDRAVKLRLLRCDLVGVDIELLDKLSKRSIALDGGTRHLRLESRCVVPARGRLCMVAPDSQATACPPSGRIPLIALGRFPGPAQGS